MFLYNYTADMQDKREHDCSITLSLLFYSATKNFFKRMHFWFGSCIACYFFRLERPCLSIKIISQILTTQDKAQRKIYFKNQELRLYNNMYLSWVFLLTLFESFPIRKKMESYGVPVIPVNEVYIFILLFKASEMSIWIRRDQTVLFECVFISY